MKFDHDKIKEKLRNFWRENKEAMQYFINGDEVSPENVSSCIFQLNEIEPSEEYNFNVTALNLRVTINSVETPYKADFSIKVMPIITSGNELPEEEIISIYNNRINLRKY